MKKFSRRILAFLLVIGSIFITSETMAVQMPSVIHDLVESDTLAEGVRYENIKRLTTSGWWNINVVRIDMTNEDTELKGLISNKGISNRETVTSLTNQNNALAGINGDFFDYTPIPSPIGGLIDNGEIITSPVDKAYAWPSFIVDKDNNAKSIILDRTMTAKSLGTAGTIKLDMINKTKSVKSTPNVSIMYNKNWADSTPGNTLTKNITEIVVDNDVVSEVRVNKGPVKLNKDRYVLHLRGTYTNSAKHFRIGDTVELNLKTVPGLENIKFMISGSSQILKDGKPTATHQNIKGNHPRTGIGVSKDGKEIILATIDGRDSKYSGVSQEMFGAILKSLGMHDAVNLDGGGSTAMAVKKTTDSNAKLVNRPSDGGQRKVADGVGVVSTAEKGKLTHIKLTSADNNIFKDTTRDIVVKGQDGHLSDVKIDQEKIKLSVEGVEGSFDGFTFTPTTKGNGKITAKYEYMESSINIRVLDNPQSIELPYKKFNLKADDKKYINPIYVTDGNGFKGLVYPRDIEFSITGDLGEFKEDGWFYSNKNANGSGSITLKLGKAVNSMLVSVGSNTVNVDSFGNINDMKFEAYPDYVNGSLSISKEAKVGKDSMKLAYDFTKGNETRAAYMTFTKPIKIDNDALTIGLWLKGDANYSSLKGTITDKNDKKHSIEFAKLIDSNEWKYIETEIPSNIDAKELNQIYVVETSKVASHKGEVLIDGLSLGYAPTYDNIKVPQATKIKDEKNIKSEVKDGGFSFVITKAQDSLNKITGRNALGDIQKLANNHNVGIYMDGISDSFSKALNNELIVNSGSPFYLGKDYKNTLFLNINTKAGGIRAQNAQQWNYIKNSIKNSNSDHIVAVMPTKVFGSGGFKDQMEAKVLHEILLEEYNKGKTVWVIQAGSKSDVEMREGIRYIEFDNRNVNNNTIKNLKAIEFVVNGEDITYQINTIF